MKNFILLIFLVSFGSQIKANEKKDSVLYIGDSMTRGPLGALIYSDLKKRFKEDHIKLYGVGSSSPRHWVGVESSRNGRWLCKRKGRVNNKSGVSMRNEICSKNNKGTSALSKINKNKNQFVVFQFLGNSMGFNERSIRRNLSKMFKQIEGQRCLFITSPPYYSALKKGNKLRLKTQEIFRDAISGRCDSVMGMDDESMTFFSTEKENYAGDNMHLSRIGAKRFFDKIKSSLP